MPGQLLIAPAGAGKTAYAVSEARRWAEGLRAAPHVLVAIALQAQAFRRRLAQAGGAIGVRVLTFEELYRLCLSTTDAVYSEISDPVQHRVIRSVVRQLALVHYEPLHWRGEGRPGAAPVLHPDRSRARQPRSPARARTDLRRLPGPTARRGMGRPRWPGLAHGRGAGGRS